MIERWRSKLRTVEAMAALSAARLLVAAAPFDRWRRTLGGVEGNLPTTSEAEAVAARVEWAASWLPFATKCLPRAMALSWLLRRRGIGHELVFAVRPATQRTSDDQLHAWVEVSGKRILGDLAGPWVETLRLGRTIS